MRLNGSIPNAAGATAADNPANRAFLEKITSRLHRPRRYLDIPPKQSTIHQLLRVVRNVVIGVLLVLLAWYAIARLADKSAVRRIEAKVSKSSQPLTLKELIAILPVVPDEQNAAAALLALWTSDDPAYWTPFLAGQRPLVTQRPKQYDPELPFLGSKQVQLRPGQQLSPASNAALEAHLQGQSNHMLEIRLALNRPGDRYPIRYEESHNALLPHLSKLRTEAQTFRLQALRAAVSGDIAAALEAVSDILRIASTLEQEPLMISQLVRAGCAGMALQSAEDLLSRQALSLKQLQSLQTLFERIEPRKMLRLSMISERVMCLSAFNDPASLLEDAPGGGSPRQNDARKGLKLVSLIGLTVADRRLILETMEQAISIADDTSPKAFERARALETSIAAKVKSFPPKLLSVSSYHPFRKQPHASWAWKPASVLSEWFARLNVTDFSMANCRSA